MIVLMHFGDGTYKEIDVGEVAPDDAVAHAREWVRDNAWFQAITSEGDDVGAEARL